ncbi:DUF2339 domain-containing protein [Sabulicella glaciei]|uniref:DUF2339 domain-containing protein n=1 Tax=Sabulicella glaciei TaxID=2984948 RepID=A0ABT3NQ50_9PROT|nr:DUF2339 domain-containing protein [Roseococcus sp. MDT2-1-1]MCW8084288.1 DUF2339 domain-containing protein [Roseococcus sp. MDT2-1-1]
MVIWGLVIGMLAGMMLAGDLVGAVIGGGFGALAGRLLLRSVRNEILRAVAPLQAEIERLRGAALPDSVANATAPAAVVLPEVAPSEGSPASAPEALSPIEAAHIPSEPSFLAVKFAQARTWLLGGNTIVRVGLLLLFLGLAFLANYAAQAGLFPVELRLALVAGVGIALLVFGFLTREARAGFALALQGGGVAVIYLTLFAATRLFDLVPLGVAFGLMVVVCALGCALALLQNAQSLAFTSFLGGFAVPLLLPGDGGSALALFGYYTLLNLAVLFIAGRRSWRSLNLLGFTATFGTATLWGLSSYDPADFWLAQGFLILSILIYIAAGITYSQRTPSRLGGAVDTTLVFGPAIAGFGLQVGLVSDQPFGPAFSALGFAGLYLGIVALLGRRRMAEMRVMSEAMLAIGVGFVTLAIPLALGAHWTSAAWALEGAGAFFVGMRQSRPMPRFFGLVLQAVAALLFLGSLDTNIATLPFLNDTFSGAFLVALSLFATAWWLRAPLAHGGSPLEARYGAFEARLGKPVFLAGFVIWWVGFAFEAFREQPGLLADSPSNAIFHPATADLLAMLAFVASAWGAQTLARRTAWPAAAEPARVTFLALWLGFLAMLLDQGWVLGGAHPVIWATAVVLHLHTLARQDQATTSHRAAPLLRAAHISGVWLLLAMLSNVLAFGIDRAHLWDTAWAAVILLVAATIVLLLLTLWAGRALTSEPGRRWPLAQHAAAYAWAAAVPVAVLLAGGTLVTALFASGNAYPLPYVPLLNPVDLSVMLAIVTLALWWRTVRTSSVSGIARVGQWFPSSTLAVLGFALLNGAWLRISHQVFGVAWNGDALLGSFMVQTGTAILWTLAALALMLVARRRADRALWLAGAGLLTLTVAKLLLVDLANAGGGARVVAFIGVGTLMLVIGYVAPLPPRLAREDQPA